MPRFGTEPSGGENDSVSEVRLSSSTLSLPATGIGSGVGVVGLSGRKMVLKPLPVKVPVNAANGPSVGVSKPIGVRCSPAAIGTSVILKPVGNCTAGFSSRLATAATSEAWVAVSVVSFSGAATVASGLMVVSGMVQLSRYGSVPTDRFSSSVLANGVLRTLSGALPQRAVMLTLNYR